MRDDDGAQLLLGRHALLSLLAGLLERERTILRRRSGLHGGEPESLRTTPAGLG